MQNFVARVLSLYPFRTMSRRALIFTTVSIVLLVWCSSLTLFTFYSVQIMRRLFLSRASFHHDFFFQRCPHNDAALCSSEISTGYQTTRGNFRVIVTLTLPESDSNHETSTNAISVCPTSSTNACKTNIPLSLRYRTPIHRAVRAVFLAIPLLFGLVDEYQRLKVSLILPVSNSISISMQKSWQISNANIQIIPYFSWFPPLYIFLFITIFWYCSLFCALIAFRTFERVQNTILEAIFPQAQDDPHAASSGVIIEEIKEEDRKEDESKFGDKRIAPFLRSSSSSSSQSMSMITTTTALTSESERSDNNGRPGLRKRKRIGGKPPDCLLNGRY